MGEKASNNNLVCLSPSLPVFQCYPRKNSQASPLFPSFISLFFSSDRWIFVHATFLACPPESFISTTFSSLFLYDHFWYNIVKTTNRITSGHYYSKQCLAVINLFLVLQILSKVCEIPSLFKGSGSITQKVPDQQACKRKNGINSFRRSVYRAVI